MNTLNENIQPPINNESENIHASNQKKSVKILNRQYISRLIENLKKPETIAVIITSVVAFVFIHILNTHTGFTSDDYKYRFVFDTMGTPTPNTERVNSIWDIIVGMKTHWKICNGRISAHALLQFVMMFGRPFLNFVNSLFYVGLGLLVYKHAKCNKRHNPILLIGIYVLFWFALPDFGTSILWKSGAANYLWMAVLILGFLLPYRLYQNDPRNDKNSTLKMIFMSILGLFAGWTNENSGGAMILLALMFISYYKIMKISIPKWSIAGVISSIVGFVLLISAPGNYRISSKATLAELLLRAEKIYKESMPLFFLLLIIFVIVLIMYVISREKSDTKKANSKDLFAVTTIYLISSVAATGALILAALQPGRTRFCSILFLIIAIGMIFAEIQFRRKTIISVVMALCVVWFGFSYNAAYKDINYTWQQVCEEEDTIKTAKESGNLDVSIKQISPPKSKYNAYKNTGYLKIPKNDWMNQWMAEYYEVNSVTGIPLQ